MLVELLSSRLYNNKSAVNQTSGVWALRSISTCSISCGFVLQQTVQQIPQQIYTTTDRQSRTSPQQKMRNKSNEWRPSFTHVQFGEQFVVFASQLFRFLQCCTHFHEVRLHLLDAHPYPLMTLQAVNQTTTVNPLHYNLYRPPRHHPSSVTWCTHNGVGGRLAISRNT